MFPVMMESLESRQFLSVSPLSSVQDAPPAPIAANTVSLNTKAIRIVGNFIGTGRVDDVSASLVLRITSQVGERVTGRLYSNGWGAFDVNLAGTLRAGKLILAGKNATCQVKRISATISGSQAIRASASVVQMGIPISTSIQFARTRTAPAYAPPRVIKLAGRYTGLAVNNENDRTRFTMRVTRQEAGHIWVAVTDPEGTVNLTGVVLKDGSFRVISRAGGVTLDITGRVQAGSIQGEYAYQGPDGADHGRISAKAG